MLCKMQKGSSLLIVLIGLSLNAILNAPEKGEQKELGRKCVSACIGGKHQQLLWMQLWAGLEEQAIMGEPMSPVRLEVLSQLQAHGIVAEYITYPRVTLTSSSRLCVRHSPLGDTSRHTLTLLDPHMSPKEGDVPASWTIHQVQGALANPSRPLLAVRGQLAQIYDVDQRSLKNEWEFAHLIEYWVWLDADTLAVVTEENVFHWTVKRTRPRWKFSRHERLCGMEIVGYHRDANHVWMALSALKLEQGQVVGLTQLYWRGGSLSQVIEAQAVALPQHRFSRNPKPSTALLAAVRRGKERMGQFHAVELGPHQAGNAALLSARGTLPFKGPWLGDFPSTVQFLVHLGVAVILTKHAFLFLADVETAQTIHCIQLTCDIIFATVIDDDRPHSLLGVCRSGKVLSISVCPCALRQYLSHHPASLSLSQRVLKLVGETSSQRTSIPVE
ncbi:clathrin heavy chain 2 isoform X2 [Anolis carolinensis]|uniref:clathrin heavy chain 2 isoform X2 n=1 Tax=Anolis carolinensis TaxID=28377 RepID=UPI000462A3BC|nr:PREDICTED: clathrin heavy chain 2 isoform X2 [Anolis carolinensis]|eukprot:XP_008103506.1 PREDICTED: clathrin heavy chain 2 isoform X2 [Anolis carolinensis]